MVKNYKMDRSSEFYEILKRNDTKHFENRLQ